MSEPKFTPGPWRALCGRTKFGKYRQVTCTCDRLGFPHRRDWKCEEHARPSENERFYADQHERDLENWAALSRG